MRPSGAVADPAWRRPGPAGYEVSTNRERLDIARIHGFLTRAYWSPGIPRDVVERAIAHSLPFGLYASAGAQVGFARAITDRATYAYLADVYVESAHRGHGLGEVPDRQRARAPRSSTASPLRASDRRCARPLRAARLRSRVPPDPPYVHRTNGVGAVVSRSRTRRAPGAALGSGGFDARARDAAAPDRRRTPRTMARRSPPRPSHAGRGRRRHGVGEVDPCARALGRAHLGRHPNGHRPPARRRARRRPAGGPENAERLFFRALSRRVSDLSRGGPARAQREHGVRECGPDHVRLTLAT